jgi:hypothetical protein
LVWAACGNPLLAAAVGLLAMMASSVHWLARPHLFTWIFLLVFSAILERARHGSTRALWLLPPLTALWTNLHGGFLFGILLIALYAVGETATGILLPARRKEGLARALSFAGAGCALASLANPYGYSLHVHLFEYLTGSFHFQHVVEFLPLNFQSPVARYFEAILLLGTVAALWHAVRGRLTWALNLCVWAHLALLSARNIPLYALVAAPLVAAALGEMLTALAAAPVASWARRAVQAFAGLSSRVATVEAWPRTHAASFLALAAVAVLLYAPSSSPRFRAEYDPHRYPAAALSVLRGAEKRIFTDDEWGDYLIYTLYPETKVYVDGRTDFYGERFETEYDGLMRAAHDWQARMDRFSIDTVLLPTTAPLVGALKESRHWRPVYDDGLAIVFRLAQEGENGRSRPSGQRPGVANNNRNLGVTAGSRRPETRDLAMVN